MTQLTLKSTILAMSLMMVAIPAHCGVYKWVDEEGRAHYSEQPPKQGKHTQLHVKPAPEIPQNKSIDFASQNLSRLCDKQSPWFNAQQCDMQRQYDGGMENMRARQQADALAAKKRNEADRKHYRDMEEKIAADAKARDDELVAECKRNREVYCDKGVERIKSEQSMRKFDEEIARKKRYSYGY
ncbi:MAG: DUF4124 domain-containing protein [Sideroxydans sp.]|nr:DUF4124 domain-containing protein [Sideroxydans sp.]